MGRQIVTKKDVVDGIINKLHDAGDELAALPKAKIVYKALDRGLLLEVYGDAYGGGDKLVLSYAYDVKERKKVLEIFELVLERLEKEYENEVVKRTDREKTATFTR